MTGTIFEPKIIRKIRRNDSRENANKNIKVNSKNKNFFSVSMVWSTNRIRNNTWNDNQQLPIHFFEGMTMQTNHILSVHSKFQIDGMQLKFGTAFFSNFVTMLKFLTNNICHLVLRNVSISHNGFSKN